MWRTLLRGSEWEPLLDLVSPTFFDLLPARTLTQQLQELGANALRRAKFDRIRRAEGIRLAASPIPVRLSSERGTEDMPAPRRARAVLGVYFHQLLASDVALLDLRAKHFEAGNGLLLWNPRPVYVRWTRDFATGLRELYAGLCEEDAARFAAALERLGVVPARAAFLEHLGGPTSAGTFSLAAFRRTFHRALVSCRDAGVTLPGNIVPFGIYVGCLHEHLEQLGGTHDVAAAYRDARDAADGTAV
ncbi:MAG: hypothetical protein JW751_19965 [Polyangiaceae bacterium]|nr:hypothetical protein [Polyangiaceae bacterium]